MDFDLDLIAVGNAVLDIVRRCDEGFIEAHGFKKGQTVVVPLSMIEELVCRLPPGFDVAGGASTNVAVGFASLGGKAEFVGLVGNDRSGRKFCHDITTAGISHRLDGPDESQSRKATSTCLVLVTPDGQRTMVTSLGASLDVSLTQEAKQSISNAKFLFLDGYMVESPNTIKVMREAASVKRRSGAHTAMSLPGLVCIDRNRTKLVNFIRSQVGFLFANVKEVATLYRVGTLETAVQAVAKDVRQAVITCSDKGSVIVFEGASFAVPADPISELVDATGAGGMYAAGFLYGLVRGESLSRCAQLANFSAAEIVTHLGARPEVRLEHLAKMRGLVRRFVA